MVGSDLGNSFEDSVVSTHLKEIHIRCESRVDSIRCVYADGSQTPKHGGDGGREEIFVLGKDEAVITVWVWACVDIDAIQFQTTTGRLSPKYGGNSGVQNLLRGHDGQRERALMGFKGRCHGILYNIEPMWSDSRQLDSLSVAIGELKGIAPAPDFDMLTCVSDPFPANLKTIKVRCGPYIDAIECIFRLPSGQEISTGSKGGNGGVEHQFTLNSNERIIRVEGRAMACIDRLQFFTSQNRSSPVYGGNGGSPFVWTPPYNGTASAANANMCLLCFQGSASHGVFRLAPVWAADPPIKFSLSIDSFDSISQEMMGKPEIGWTDQHQSDNKTDQTVTHKSVWTLQASKSSSVTLSESSRNKVGGKVTSELSVKGKAGVPFCAEVEVAAKVGLEVSAEHEWGSSATDGSTVSRTFTVSVEESIPIPPKKRFVGKAVGYQMKVTGLKWLGTMTVTYAGGSTKAIPVEGTIDSASVTKIHTFSEFVDL